MNRALPVALLLLSCTSALAAGLEPKAYVARRLTAEQHLQMEVREVSSQASGCRVAGTVRQVFRGKAALGDTVVFALPCAADSFWTADKLRSSRLLEVFLKPGLGGLEAADDGQGIRALAAPSERPVTADDPALVREMSESIARYNIDAEIKRREVPAALALARVDDPDLRARLLAHAAGLLSAHKQPEAEPVGDEAVSAVKALGDNRLDTGLVALESLAMGGDRKPALALAALLEPEVEALTVPSRRDAGYLVLYGARIRSDDPNGAMAALNRIGDPATRRDRLGNMPFAQKDFSPANPDSLGWMDRLLGAAEALPAGEFRQDALTQLCRTAQRSAMEMTRLPELTAKAAAMAEVSARRRHAPSAQLLALLREAMGGPDSRIEAARWHAVAARGFDGGNRAEAESLKALATFTPAERAAAARLLDPKAEGVVSPRRLVELAAK